MKLNKPLENNSKQHYLMDLKFTLKQKKTKLNFLMKQLIYQIKPKNY